MRRNNHILFSVLLFLPFITFSQDILTLDDAIAIGLENSFSIRIARNETQIAQNNNTLGNAGFLPNVGANASHNSSYQNRYRESADGSSASDNAFPTHTLGAGAQLGWTLFDGFAMFIRKEKLETFHELSNLQLRMAVENNIAQIVHTFYSIAYNENLCKSYKDQMDLSRERLIIAQEKSNIGVGYELQELQSEVDFRSDSARFLQQSNHVVNLKAELNRLLARPSDVPFTVNTAIPVPEFELFEDVITKAEEQNVSLLMARLQTRILSLEINEARSSRYPDINFNGAYNYSRTRTPHDNSVINQMHGPSFGVAASITLFNGFNVNRRIKNATIYAENQQIQEEELALAVESRIFQLVNNLNQSIELVSVEEKSLVLAQRNADTSWEKYRLGAISDIELRESQNKLLDAQTRLISAQMTAQSAAIEIKTITGDLGEFLH